MLNMQNVKDIEIPEGDVRTIHDKDNRLIWGRLAYDTKYAGDTFQQTYSGKNVFNENDLSFDRTNVSANQIQLSALATGIRFNTTYISTTGSPSITFNTGIDLTPLAGKTIRLKANFGEKGEARIIRLNNDSLSAETQTLTVSGGTISWVVPNDLGSSKWLGYGFRIVYPSNEIHTVDFTNVCITIDNADMSYEPYTGGIPAPNPDYPQPIQVVTGEQTVTIGDGVDSEDFTISLGPIELCKIGDYQDYIYKSGDDWYVHKECGKVVFDGTEAWSGGASTGSPTYLYAYTSSLDALSLYSERQAFCSHFSIWPNQLATGTSVTYPCMSVVTPSVGTYAHIRLMIPLTIAGDIAALKTWLGSHNTNLYYVLATPTDTKITDATLIGQLDAIHEWLTRYGYSATVTGNLPIIINQTNL